MASVAGSLPTCLFGFGFRGHLWLYGHVFNLVTDCLQGVRAWEITTWAQGEDEGQPRHLGT